VHPIPKPKSSGKVVGPTPIVCLKGAGLLKVGTNGTNKWIGYDDATEKPIFVDGPFTNVKAAKEDVSSLKGIELAARGGLYVISAYETSHLTGDIKHVAACLATTSGSGSLNF
jgi:hypothetical protein